MSGLPPPGVPPSPAETEVIRLLKMLLAVAQVIAAVLAILTLMLAGWLLGIFPDVVSPIVEVQVS